MKTLLYSLLLAAFLITPAWSDSHDNAGSAEAAASGTGMDVNDNDTVTEEDLERKIKGKVLSIIVDVIDAASDELSEEEKSEIKKEINEAISEIEEDVALVEEDSGHNIRIGSGNGPAFSEAILGALAIFFIFGTPIMIIAAILYFSYRKKRLMHDTINQYVSSGKDIPPEVLKGLQKETAPKNNLHRGLVMSGVGLGIFACFAVIGSLEAAALGLIPLFIGLAQLLIWKLENK